MRRSVTSVMSKTSTQYLLDGTVEIRAVARSFSSQCEGQMERRQDRSLTALAEFGIESIFETFRSDMRLPKTELNAPDSDETRRAVHVQRGAAIDLKEIKRMPTCRACPRRAE